MLLFETTTKALETLIERLITICKANDMVNHLTPNAKTFSYKTVDIFKPNLKEVKEGLNPADR